MPLNQEAQSLLDTFADVEEPAVADLTPVYMRDGHLAMITEAAEDSLLIRDLDADGIPVRLYLAPDAEPEPGLLVFFHGGGWVTGNIDTHDNICRYLANRSGQGVLSVEYRLAPENPFPAGLDDCLSATRWAHANAPRLGFDPDRIAVGGDSAGGNLAAVVCQALVDQAEPISLKFQLLLYPVTDCRAGSASYEENSEGYFLTEELMHWFIDHYLSGSDGSAEDPRASPLLASEEVLSKCPPALVITAGFDPLRDEGAQYADRLTGQGVVTSHVHYPGQFHGFMSLAHLLGEGRSALALAAQALSEL